MSLLYNMPSFQGQIQFFSSSAYLVLFYSYRAYLSQMLHFSTSLTLKLMLCKGSVLTICGVLGAFLYVIKPICAKPQLVMVNTYQETLTFI